MKKKRNQDEEKSAETGKKLQNFVTARSLWQQDITFKERGAAGERLPHSLGLRHGSITGRYGCAGTDPAGDMAVQRISERREKKKEQEFQKQFREMIQSLSAALNTGYSVENAFYETQKELKILILRRPDF